MKAKKQLIAEGKEEEVLFDGKAEIKWEKLTLEELRRIRHLFVSLKEKK